MVYRRCVAAASVLLAAVAVWAGVASAAPPPKNFIALLNSSQEVPPTGTTATGIAYLTFTDSTKELCYHITFNDLSAAESDAHIHGPALPGVDGAILYGLPAGPVKSGCITLANNTEKSNLLKNLLYINIHSAAFSGGEIRGQILRVK